MSAPPGQAGRGDATGRGSSGGRASEGGEPRAGLAGDRPSDHRPSEAAPWGGERSAVLAGCAGPLRRARLASGLSQQDLAQTAGVTRQAVAGLESGRWDPSLRVALALARALGRSVEELFDSPGEAEPAEARSLDPTITAETAVELAMVGGTQVALALRGERALRAGFLPSSGRLVAPAPAGAVGEMGRRWLVEATAPARPTLVVAGCDPAIPLLADALGRLQPPMRLAWWPCGSSQALELAAAGLVHAAGAHGDEAAGSRYRASTAERLAIVGAEVIGFAAWEEGIALRRDGRGTPGSLTDVADRALRFAHREPGSQARALFERERRRLRLAESAVVGAGVLSGHLMVATAIATSLADAGITTRPAALAFDLDFVPLAQERSELVIPRPMLDTREVRALLAVLGTQSVRRQLAALAGYDVRTCGEQAGGVEAQVPKKPARSARGSAAPAGNGR